MRKVFKILSNVLGVLLCLLLFWVLLGIFRGSVIFVIIAALIVFIISFLLSNGKKMIMKERTIIDNQLAAKVPINFSKKRVILGYVQMFSFLWLLIPSVFLIPSSVAWAYILPPVLVVFFALSSYWKNTWLELGFTKGRYFLLHLCGILIPSITVTTIKIISYLIK